MPNERPIDDETLAILSASTRDGLRLTLPAQLPRPTYDKVMKVIEALGGAWKRGSKKEPGAHVFSEEGLDALENALLTGRYTKPSDPKIDWQFFETPEPVALRLVQLAEPARLGMFARVLEPSAGNGAILRVLGRHLPDNTVLWANDLNPERGNWLIGAGYVNPYNRPHDFLVELYGSGLDLVVQNPPFTRRQDAKHILRAFRLLRPGGRLVSVASAGIRFRREAEYEEIRALVERHGTVEDLPPGSFRASGTDVNTVVVVLEKP